MRERLWRFAISALALGWFSAGRCLAQAPNPAPEEVPPAAEAAAEEPAQAAPAVPDLPGPPPIPDVQLGPVLKTMPIRHGGAPFNVQMVDASIYAREKAPQLDYRDQTANFVIGQKVTGGTSGATAVIEDDIDRDTFGTLILSQIQGTFLPDEPITTEEGGAAVVDGSLREGIWVLDFAFKPVRIQDVDIPGRGRRHVYYLYYRVVNRTGKPRMLVPQFTLITDPGKPTAKRYEDKVIPQAIRVIQNREDPGIPLLGAVQTTGILPASTREGIDDALFGVALWEGVDPKADTFRIYVRGLSDGYNIIPPPGGSGQPLTQYKALQINCETPGNNPVRTEREVYLGEPPFEWVYYPPMPGGTAANIRRQ